MKYKVTITEITEWQQDDARIRGDASHVGYADVYALLAEECERKEESGEAWTEGLPFTVCVTAENAEDAKEDALTAYADKHCEYDLLLPIDCECDIEAI